MSKRGKDTKSEAATSVKKHESNNSNRKNDDGESEKKQVSLFSHPLLTLKIFAIVLSNYLVSALKYILKNVIVFVILLLIIILPHAIHGSHSHQVEQLDEVLLFAAYWIALGIASSIGLGTGLHTFVLYLGPHIAKVTMAAHECRAVPVMLPSKWKLEKFQACAGVKPTELLSVWSILQSVQFEAFLWGLGTAIGELPPYFVAKAASVAGKAPEELLELQRSNASGLSLMDRIKLLIYAGLQKWGFLTVLLSASIPNPLFDLAGITCGHFNFPFWSFFGATMIGKAIIKVHIQTLFVIFVFSAHHVENLIRFFETKLPFLKQSLTQMLENQKSMLFDKKIDDGSKPLIGRLWDLFILGMVVFFVVSIVNSLVNQYLDEQENGGKKEKKKDSPSKSDGKKKKK